MPASIAPLGSTALRSALPAAVAVIVATGCPSTAHGQPGPESQLDLAALLQPGVYLPVGASIGGAYRDETPDGLRLGGEASLVSFGQVGPPGAWFGGYVDGCWDFGVDGFRHGTGPQFGLSILGIDLGYLGELRAGSYRPGFAARGFVTLGVVSVFGRYGRLYGENADADEDVAEFGVLAKVPFRLSDPPDRADENAAARGNSRSVMRSARRDAR